MRHQLQKYSIHTKFLPTPLLDVSVLGSKYKNPLFLKTQPYTSEPGKLGTGNTVGPEKYPTDQSFGACTDNTHLSMEDFSSYVKTAFYGGCPKGQGSCDHSSDISGEHTFEV